MTQILLRRGPAATIPTLANGEPAWTTDTHQLYVGDGTTNHQIGSGGGGGVTSVTASAPLTSSGGTAPNITHNTSGVTAGSYTNANITVDAYGHVTMASNGSGGGGGVSSLDGITGAITLVAGTGITITNNSPMAGQITIAATGGGGGGSVTSVGLALPAEFTVTGSPVTSAGTLTGAWANQSANTVFAGPSTAPSGGGTGVPSFRSLVGADLPVMGPSGAMHAQGAVPDPGATAGTTRYLREDGTWQVPSGGSGSGGGVNVQSGPSYTPASTDNGKLIVLTYTAATPTLVLNGTGLSTGWYCDVSYEGAANSYCLVNSTNVSLDGGTSSFHLGYQQGIRLFWGGSSFYTNRGVTANPVSGTILGFLSVAADESTTSTTYTDLTTVESITFTLPASGSVLVEYNSLCYNTTVITAGGANFTEVYLDGGPQTASQASQNSPNASCAIMQSFMYALTGLAPGSHTITVKHHAGASGVAHWMARSLKVTLM